MIIPVPPQWYSHPMLGHMDHISPVSATPRKGGWSCQVELLLVGEALAATMKAASFASSAMARPWYHRPRKVKTMGVDEKDIAIKPRWTAQKEVWLSEKPHRHSCSYG
jgi:hypothetical protein